MIITLNFIYKQKLIDKFNNIKRLHWIKKTGELKDFVSAVKNFTISIRIQSFVLVEKTQTYEDKFAKMAAVKPVAPKKEIDPDAIADGEDFVAKEDQAEEMVISLDDQKEIEETLEKDQDN